MRIATFGKTDIGKEGDEILQYDIMNYAGNPKIDGQFDVIVISLELAKLPRQSVMPFLENINSMLKSRGELKLYVPCAEYASKQIFTNTHDQVTFFSLYGSDDQPFRACYTLLNLRNLMERSNFIVRIANEGIMNLAMSTGDTMQMPVNFIIATKE